jgi:gas vesicle protein
MLNEGRGISDINKIETENIFDILNKNGFSTFEYQILNKIIEITFSLGNYDSKCYKKNKNFYLLLTAPKDYDSLKLKTVITHELTHFIEISNIEDKKYTYPNYNKIKKALLDFKPDNKQLEFFKHLIYKTLDNEINANVAQTYTYLRNFNSNDEKFLKEKLEDYSIRKEYKTLLDFNISKFKEDIEKNNIKFDEFNEILLKYNVDEFLDFIKNKKNDMIYIDNWFKMIRSNINKLLSKQNKIIKEVIEDVDEFNNHSTEYPVSEATILSYDEYIKENLKNNIVL